MSDQEKKARIPQSDSGYYSNPSSDVVTGVAKQKERVFSELISALHTLELGQALDADIEFELKDCTDNSQKQIKHFNSYQRNTIAKDNETIKRELHFTGLDLVYTAIRTVLAQNEGSAFLALAKNSLNRELLEKTLKTISIERGKNEDTLLKTYITKKQENILHCLASLIAEKYDRLLPVTAQDRVAFDHFANLAPELKEQKNKTGRTPVEIIENAERRAPFKALIITLYEHELKGEFQEQIDLLKKYLEKIQSDHFEKLDLALEGYSVQTKLPNNEGRAFLELAKNCSNITVLENFLTAICDAKKKNRSITPIEESQSKIDLLKTYIDEDNENILHSIEDLILKKNNVKHSITEALQTYEYFATLVPALTEQKNKGTAIDPTDEDDEESEYEEGFTAAEVLQNETGIEIDINEIGDTQQKDPEVRIPRRNRTCTIL